MPSEPGGFAARPEQPMNEGAAGRETSPSSGCAPVPLGPALFRVMRATMFEEAPVEELDALPLAQLRLLWTVHFLSLAPMKEFSERLGVAQSTVTQLADQLVRRGLVERQPDPEDRRVVRLHTSAVGAELLRRAEVQQAATHSAVWSALSSEQQAEVMRGLTVLADAAEEVRREQGRPLAPLPDRPAVCDGSPDLQEGPHTQTVVDLMSRRVRGRSQVG